MSTTAETEFVLYYPVVQVGGQLYLRENTGATHTLFVSPGQPAVFVEGWSARLLVTAFHPLRLLELQHTSGAQATWYLDANNCRLCDAVIDLPAWARDHLKQASADIFAQPQSPAGAAKASAFMLLNPATRSDIATLHIPGDAALPLLEAEQRQLALIYASNELRPLIHVTPSIGADASRYATAGLDAGASAGAWWSDGSCEIKFRALSPAACYFMRINLGRIDRAMQFHVAVNGRAVGEIALTHWHAEGAYLGFWLPVEMNTARELAVALRGWRARAGAKEPAGFSLDSATLLAGGDKAGLAAATAALPPAELMERFESIGDNCDFGTVQRYYGIEPLGLLRFASVGNVRNLVRMLDDRMRLLGAPHSLGHFLTNSEYMILDKNYGLTYHTFKYSDKIDVETVYRENETKLVYLKRKLEEDFEDGEKIFIYKRDFDCKLNEILALHAVLNIYGPVKLFWVSEVEPGRKSGDVEWIGRRLLHGFVDRISFESFADLKPDPWLHLCRNAYVEFARSGPEGPAK